MKSMYTDVFSSSNFRRFSFLYFATFLLLVNSCTDPCTDVICSNGSVCDSGNCVCSDGFEGDDCSIEARAKYFGTYSFTQIYEVCPNNFSETVSQSGTFIVRTSTSSVQEITIQYGTVTFEAELDANKFEAAPYSINTSNGIKQITPSGSFFNDKLNMTLKTTETVAGVQVNCTETIEAKQ